MRFSHYNSDGAEICAVGTEHLWSGVYGLHLKPTNEIIDSAIWLDLIKLAMDGLIDEVANFAID